ncbi:hypothetical protein NNJEOMEG_03118 [Fundidesulfovibrio magnetotacticus]|uniref:DUF86 domain-containing protein n=1 Tax=Fundidesulfovibrio magnetotacticus TaxID=2730080 RepID=A0A6V8LWJ1_9BACT|nr:hypothetical protein [Fundidesulfovibrio magnetotacticus]GFK95260.1 hypothetical protein NNJEOMEG_03118 [Fundidesulfovibrio magnetotacticus]
MSALSAKELIAKGVAQLERSAERLGKSYEICLKANRESPADEDYDAFEALAGRFSRTSDILLQKVFRALDAYDLYESGTPLDVINRADKRELFDDVGSIKRIRALRNTIAHEYELEDIVRLMNEILLLTPDLLEACKRSIAYARELIES